VLLAVSLLWASAGLAQEAGGDQGPPPPAVPEALLKGDGGAASQAFAQGDYAEAARRFEVLLETRGDSAALYHNVGTSWSLAGEPGRAIWALERARLLDPGDPDTAHNLEVTRQRVRVERVRRTRGARLTEGEPEGLFWFRLLTAREGSWWVWLALLTWALGWALLAWRRRLPAGGRKDGVTVAASLLLVVGLALVGALTARAAVIAQVHPGVVLAQGAQLARAPVVTATRERHPDLYAGAVVRVLERRSDGWSHVRLVDGTQGWLTSQEVAPVVP
jgi:hypothetical protein